MRTKLSWAADFGANYAQVKSCLLAASVYRPSLNHWDNIIYKLTFSLA